MLLALTVAALTTASCAGMNLRAEPGSVLFQDDFARPSSGWDRYRDSAYSSDFHEGAYRIEVITPGTWAWSTPRLSLRDVRVEVDARKVSGPDDNVFGILCRYQNASNYLVFLVSSDGYVGIGMRRDGANTLVSGESLLLRDAVLQGNTLNHLRADCVGEDLRLFVNGLPVVEAQSSVWSEGDVGLIAGTYEQGEVVIAFDNFSVLQP
jgi:hypothetical protein